MVDETKYGSSRLARTQDGNLQIGKAWTSKRLAALASRFRKIAGEVDRGMTLKIRPASLGSRQQIRIPLGNGAREVVFWRNSSTQSWNFDGSANELGPARRQLERYEKFLAAASQDRISYARRVSHVNIKGNELNLTLRDAANVERVNGVMRRLPVTGRAVIPLAGNSWTSREMTHQIQQQIQKAMPHWSKSEIDRLVADMRSRTGKPEELLSSRSYSGSTLSAIGRGAGIGALIAGPLDAGIQWLTSGELDWGRFGITTGVASVAGATGTAAGYGATRFLLKSTVGQSLAGSTAKALGMNSAGRFSSLAVGAAAGGVASAVFSYGMWLMGEMDLRTANRSFVAGTVGTLAGVGASTAIMSLVSAYGVAGTGTAISTLSGAAATNASLAYLGGGTLASGGLGAAGGSIVLAVPAVGAAILFGAGVWSAFSWGASANDNERIALTLDYLLAR